MYPPYNKLIRITLKNKEPNPLNECGTILANALREKFEKRVLGPEYPVVSRIRGFYLKNILLKVEREASMVKVKSLMEEIIELNKALPIFKGTRVVIDVDPY